MSKTKCRFHILNFRLQNFLKLIRHISNFYFLLFFLLLCIKDCNEKDFKHDFLFKISN